VRRNCFDLQDGTRSAGVRSLIECGGIRRGSEDYEIYTREGSPICNKGGYKGRPVCTELMDERRAMGIDLSGSVGAGVEEKGDRQGNDHAEARRLIKSRWVRRRWKEVLAGNGFLKERRSMAGMT